MQRILHPSPLPPPIVREAEVPSVSNMVAFLSLPRIICREAANHMLAACTASAGGLCRGNEFDRAPVFASFGWCSRSESECWPSTSRLLFFGSFRALPTRTRDEEGTLCQFLGARTLVLDPRPVFRPCRSSPLQSSGRGAVRLTR
jgi:hypothetical protein